MNDFEILKKVLINQSILTREEIEDLINSQKIIDKLLDEKEKEYILINSQITFTNQDTVTFYHGFGKIVNVVILNNNNYEIDADIQHNSDFNRIMVYFSSPMTGIIKIFN